MGINHSTQLPSYESAFDDAPIAQPSPTTNPVAPVIQPVDVTQETQDMPPRRYAMRKRVRADVALVNPKRVKATEAEFDTLLRTSAPSDPFGKRVVLKPGQRTNYETIEPGMLLYHPARLVVRSKKVESGIPTLEVTELSADPADPARTYKYQGAALVESRCFNCDQFTDVQQKTMTEMAALLRHQVGDSLCKVEFTKEPEGNDMATMLKQGSQIIEDAWSTNAEKQKQYKRLYERTCTGEYRIMRGYLLRDADMSAQETETGMLRFLDADLMAAGKYAQRQINLRHIQALVFKNVRYERK